MKNKTLVIISVLSLVFGFSGQLSHPTVAFARDNGSENIGSSGSESDSGTIDDRETPDAARVDNGQSQEDNNDDSDINDNDRDNGTEHRNEIEKIANKLQEVADQHNELDDDLNEVIGGMASSSKEATEAIDNLDNEGAAKKFFLGPDFKSLGELRDTIVTTQNHIDRLTKAQERVTDPAAKATLDAQIAALKDVASSTQEFLDSHERTFSLFGWLVKLFS